MFRKNGTLISKQRRTYAEADNLFVTDKRYRFLLVLGNVSVFIFLILAFINVLLGFMAYVSSQLLNYHFAQFLGQEDISFIKMFELFYFNDVVLLRNVFITMFLTFIIACISFCSLYKIEKSIVNS